MPPDGRFVLAGYDVDLLDPTASPLSAKAQDLNLPASVEIRTGLGTTGADFEVRLTISHRFSSSSSSGTNQSSTSSSSAAASLSNNLSRPNALRAPSADTKTPLLDDLIVTIPIPPTLRNISDLRATKGEAHWSPGETAIEWKVSAKEAASISSAGAILRCSVVGDADDEDVADALANGVETSTYDYDDDVREYQAKDTKANSKSLDSNDEAKDARKGAQNAVLMPSSANLSFGVKGWLASGLRVDSLVIDTKRSNCLGEGVRPYNGVKYLTVSTGAIEVRC